MAPKSKKAGEEVTKKVEREPVTAVTEEPADKKQKTDEKAAAVEKPVEKPAEVEKEVDDKPDKRSKVTETINFEPQDSTLNVVPAMGGKVLMSLSEGGLQYFIASARANASMKAGRYFFEVKIVEELSQSEGGQWGRNHAKTPQPRQYVRLGFSTEGSAAVLGAEMESAVFFDSEGVFHSSAGRKKGQRFSRGQVVGVLLNLDAASANANTVSLFKDGKRVSEPHALPEALHGKALLPHVAYRNVTLHVNFGAEPLAPLPFACRTLQEAAQGDVTVTKQKAPKDGKYEVVYPVGFPDEGTFHWLDGFLKENKSHFELSERKILQWAAQSGFTHGVHKTVSNDRPAVNFGVPGMDDNSVKRVINSIASVVPRNYVVMEVKQNLTEADRQLNLKRFPGALYKRIARVAMGEPNAAFKKVVKDKLLKDKQAKAQQEWIGRKAEREKKKNQAKRAKEAAAFQKKKAEEAKARIEAAKKAKEAAAEKKEGEEEKKEEAKPAEEEKKEEPEEAEEPEEPAPGPVSLTEEEEKIFFPKAIVPDLTSQELERSFGKFTIPKKSEGFDDVKFEWLDAAKSDSYLRTWVLEKKRTSRVDTLKIGEWFTTQQAEWKKKVMEWQAKHKEAAGKATKKMDDDDAAASADIFSVKDVCDVGNGDPLFQNFGSDDWTLMNLRWELFTLITAFKKDVDDADREAMPEVHAAHYYHRYFKKPIVPKQFGKETFADVVGMVKDTAAISDKQVLGLAGSLDADAGIDIFVKLTEDARRERQRRLDAGDEGARLKLAGSRPAQTPAPKAGAAPKAA